MPYESKRRPDLGTWTPVRKVIQGNKVKNVPQPPRPIGGMPWKEGEQVALSQRLIKQYGLLRRNKKDTIFAAASIFPAAQETSQFLADKTSLPTTESTSSILATMSTPDSQRTEHDMGRVMALHLLERIGDSKFNWHIQQANRKQQTIHLMERETGGKVKYANEISQLQGEIDRHRIGAGIAGTPLGQMPVHHVYTAAQMLHGTVDSPLENVGISTTLGREASPIRFSESLRRTDLAQQIETGGAHPGFPVDADIFDAITRRTDTPYEFARGISKDMNYRSLQGVGEQAFKVLERRSTSGLIPGTNRVSDFLNAIWLDQHQKHEGYTAGMLRPQAGRADRLAEFVAHNPLTNPRTYGLPPLQLPPKFGL